MKALIAAVIMLGVALGRPMAATPVPAQAVALETPAAVLRPLVAAGIATIVVYADRGGSKQTRPWLQALASSHCTVVEAAALQAVPAVARPFVKRAFRKSPQVHLDWHGRIAAVFGFVENSANVYVFDKAGVLAMHLHGAAEADKLAALDALTRQTCPEEP